MTWYLKIGAYKKSFADWGLGQLRRCLQSQAADTVTFSAIGANFDADELAAAFGDPITIYRDDAIWFQGIITKIPRSGSDSAESMQYEVSGPWWYLENLVFRQLWNINGGDPVYSSRVILGQAQNGDRIASNLVIEEALAYAIGASAPFQIGDIQATLQIPYDEQKDISCAEVVRTVLRWNPDCIAFFDYATSPATLHIRNRAGLTAVNLAYGEDVQTIKSVDIVPRTDLQVPAVVLAYEITTTTDGEPNVSFTIDKWPLTATGREFRALVMTIPWKGQNITTTKQPIKTRTIEDHFADDTLLPLVRKWWKQIHPQFANMDDSEWAFHDVDGWTPGFLKIQFADPDQLDKHGHPAVIDGLPNELVDGQITPWMEESPFNRRAYRVIMTANILIIPYAQPQEYHVEITATDAATSTYTTSDTDPGDAVPVGVAQSFYNMVSRLHYEGLIALEEGECGGLVQLGNAVNIVGGRAEWTAMQAMVQGIAEDVDGGATKIKIGPPQHLSIQNMIELLRVARPGASSSRQQAGTGPQQRSTGKSANTVQLGQVGGGRNATSPAASIPFTFEAVIKSDVGRQVWVRPGMISGVTPIIGGSPLIALLAAAPVLTVGTADAFIYWHSSSDSHHAITSVSIASGTTIPADSDTDAFGPIAAITIVDGIIAACVNLIDYSLSVQYCNGLWLKGAGS